MQGSSIIIPTTVEGALLSRLRELFGWNAQIQESYIRVEKDLTAQSVAQDFLLTGTTGSAGPMENFISKNDLQVIYAMKVGVNKRTTALNGNNGNSVDYTYPDLGVFSAAAAPPLQSEAACLESIWSGTIGLKSDTFEALNKQSLKKWRVVPRTQVTASTQASFGKEDSGFIGLHQPTIFSGQSTITLSFLQAPGSDVAQIAGAAGTQNSLFFHFLSFVVRNGAQSINAANFDQATLEMLTKGRVW